MPELSTLLHRAAPHDGAPVDVDRIRRLTRRRQQRRVRRGAGAVVVVVLGAFGGVLLAAPSGDEAVEQVTATAPDRPTVSEGMGTWTELPEAPFANVTDLVPLSDGRVLAWGSTVAGFISGPVTERAFPALAIFDPEADAWSTIDHPASLDSLHLLPVRFADDRLAVLGSIDGDGRFVGSVFDAETGDWTAIPALEELRVLADAVAWDGETLVVVRTALGEIGPVGTGFGPDTSASVNADPDDPAYSTTIDFYVDTPQTWPGASGQMRGPGASRLH